MKTRSLLLLGLVTLLIVSTTAVPQQLPAQQPGSVPAPAGKTGESVPSVQAFLEERQRTQAEVQQRTEAQVQAQLRLLEVQKRQLEEQVKEQIRELEEQEREQIDQLMAEAKRQADQLRRQAKRQIEQVRLRARWQQEQLDVQRRLVETQAGIPSQSTTPAGLTATARREPGLAPAVGETLERILNRLEGIEKRLDRLEKAR
jgi:hypothetical protein